MSKHVPPDGARETDAQFVHEDGRLVGKIWQEGSHGQTFTATDEQGNELYSGDLWGDAIQSILVDSNEAGTTGEILVDSWYDPEIEGHSNG